MDYQDLGRRIRKARKERRLTQEQLAEMVGISASFLGHIERGSRIASVDTLVGLCNALQVTPESLLCGSLHLHDKAMPSELNADDRARLSAFLRMAQDTVRNWNK